MTFDQEKFNQFVLRYALGVREEAFTLRSGRHSHLYVNWRDALTSPRLLNQLRYMINDFFEDHGLFPNNILGVPEGMTAAAAYFQICRALAESSGGDVVTIRKVPKQYGHGKDSNYIGKISGKVVLLEDTTTSGTSLIETIEKIRVPEVTDITAIAFTDRMQIDDQRSVEQRVNSLGVDYFAMSKGTDLLRQAYAQGWINDDLALKLEQEYTKHGIEPLNLLRN